MTGIGPARLRCAAHGVRDRVGQGSGAYPIFLGNPSTLCASLEESGGADPILYLKGISTGEFGEALQALLGKDAGGLSVATVARLKELGGARAGRGVMSRPNAISISGSTASMSRPGSRMRRNACW
jgi:hypothetical protein